MSANLPHTNAHQVATKPPSKSPVALGQAAPHRRVWPGCECVLEIDGWFGLRFVGFAVLRKRVAKVPDEVPCRTKFFSFRDDLSRRRGPSVSSDLGLGWEQIPRRYFHPNARKAAERQGPRLLARTFAVPTLRSEYGRRPPNTRRRPKRLVSRRRYNRARRPVRNEKARIRVNFCCIALHWAIALCDLLIQGLGLCPLPAPRGSARVLPLLFIAAE